MTLAARGVVETAAQPRPAPETSRLVVPVVLLLMLSTAMIGVLTLLAARSLDEHQAAGQRRLALALVDHNLRHIAKQAYDYGWWDEMAAQARPDADPVWADANVGSYIHKAYGYNSSWVVGPDDATHYAFIDGRPTDRALLAVGGAAVRALLEATRASPLTEPEPASGLVLIDGHIHFAGACAITDSLGTGEASASRPVLVFTRRLDPAMLREAEETYGLRDLRAQTTAPSGPDWDSTPLIDPTGAAIGFLAWRLDAPGHDLMLQIWPALAIALAAMLLLALLFVRRAHESGERQLRLALALERERELRELKTRFVNMVSHEIRTPLTVIRSASDMLLRYGERLTIEERGREVSAIQREVAQLTGMVEDVLALGRAERADRPPQTQTVDLEAAARAHWAQAERAVGRRLPVSIEVADDARTVRLDPEILRAILVNLFVNAVKFSPGGLPAEVRIARIGDDVSVSVRDRGIGVPASELDSVFEPFHRAANVGAVSGSGLGLAIVRQCVARHGGEVRMTSREGEGTEVRLRLKEARGTE